MGDLRSPLSKARGLGTAREGTGHFWHQRLTSLLLVPLVLWLGFSLAAMPVDHATLVDWIRQPLVTVALLLLIAVLFYHAQLGLQVVIEDYVGSHSKRTVTLLVSSLLCLVFGLVGMVSVLRIAFGS